MTLEDLFSAEVILGHYNFDYLKDLTSIRVKKEDVLNRFELMTGIFTSHLADSKKEKILHIFTKHVFVIAAEHANESKVGHSEMKLGLGGKKYSYDRNTTVLAVNELYFNNKGAFDALAVELLGNLSYFSRKTLREPRMASEAVLAFYSNNEKHHDYGNFSGVELSVSVHKLVPHFLRGQGHKTKQLGHKIGTYARVIQSYDIQGPGKEKESVGIHNNPDAEKRGLTYIHKLVK